MNTRGFECFKTCRSSAHSKITTIWIHFGARSLGLTICLSAPGIMTDNTPEQLEAQLQIARANDEKDRTRIKRNLKLLKKTDDLDSAIYDVVESWMDTPLTGEEDIMTTDDVEDITQSLPSLKRIIVSGFFNRLTFPFRIFQQLIFLHDVNPVPTEFMPMFMLKELDQKNNGFNEQLWFLLFLGADLKDIDDIRAQHKSQQSEFRSLHMGEHPLNRGNSRSSGLTLPYVTGITSLVNPTGSHLGDLSTLGARAHDNQDARSGLVSGVTGTGNLPKTPAMLNAYTSSIVTRAEVPITHSHSGPNGNNPDCALYADSTYVQGKKGHAVEAYFTDKKFSSAPKQSIDNLIRDFHICSVHQALNPMQKSLFFINALSDLARQFFLTNCSSEVPFNQIKSIMQRRYSSDTRKVQIQSEMDSLDLRAFMEKNQITDYAYGLSKLIDHIYALSPQLPQGFNDDAHKTRYLRRAVMSQDWAQTAISHIATSKYSLIQFVTALRENIQLQEERSRARAPDLYLCGQYLNHPGDVAKPNNRNGNRSPSPHKRHPMASSPYGRDIRFRSRSPRYPRQSNWQDSRSLERTNPNFRTRRLC